MKKIKHLRWWICGLLFIATTINYLDRQSLAVLKPILSKDLGWDEAQFGWIVFSFQTAYAIMMAVSGRLIDWLGVRTCFAAAVVIWSLAAMAHAFARGAFGFAVARFFLGLGEAANFPASIKAVAEWFPKRERALAVGIFNSGTNVGVSLAPIVVFLATQFSWQVSFVFVGATGFLWLIIWLKFYRSPKEHPLLDPKELAIIESDDIGTDNDASNDKAAKVSWIQLLRYRQAWAFSIGKFMTDPVWWFYLTWLPAFLKSERGLSSMSSAKFLIVPYLAADIGSIGGGWLSSVWIKRGWSVGSARYAAMLITAICMPCAVWAVFTDSLWLTIALVSIATSAHQGWSANIFTTASDMFPKQMVGSVVGLGASAGAIGGMIMTLVAGGMLQLTGSYVVLFILAGVLHPTALIIFRLLAGKDMAPATFKENIGAKASPVLLFSGAVLFLLSITGIYLMYSHWADIVVAMKGSGAGAAAGMAVSVAFGLIGTLLLYAGRKQKA